MSKEVSAIDYFKKNEVKILTAIDKALPKHVGVDADRMMSVVRFELNKNQKLQKCTPLSILGSFMQACQLGLEPSGSLGLSYLIPYKDKCTFILGYRGMLVLARRSGQIKSITAQAVYEGDTFEYKYGLDEKLDHIPARKERGKFIYAYAYAKLFNTFDQAGKESYQFEVMTKSDIDDIRNKTPFGSSSDSPWTTHYEEMAKKTVIRRLFKYLPVSIEAQRAAAIDEAYERGDEDNVIDLSEIETIEDKPQTKSEILSGKINVSKPPIQTQPNFDDRIKNYEQSKQEV